MPKGKRKVKKVGLMERILNKCGYVRAPKKRVGKVSVKPYNRKAPAVKVGEYKVTAAEPEVQSDQMASSNQNPIM